MRPPIEWCEQHHRGTAVPFHFVHADIRNSLYNPTGRFDAADYVFPYSAGAFDLAIAISVFTHLVPASAERYLSEASRVLAPGGRLLLAWFSSMTYRPATPISTSSRLQDRPQSSTPTTPKRRPPTWNRGSKSI